MKNNTEVAMPEGLQDLRAKHKDFKEIMHNLSPEKIRANLQLISDTLSSLTDIKNFCDNAEKKVEKVYAENDNKKVREKRVESLSKAYKDQLETANAKEILTHLDKCLIGLQDVANGKNHNIELDAESEYAIRASLVSIEKTMYKKIDILDDEFNNILDRLEPKALQEQDVVEQTEICKDWNQHMTSKKWHLVGGEELQDLTEKQLGEALEEKIGSLSLEEMKEELGKRIIDLYVGDECLEKWQDRKDVAGLDPTTQNPALKKKISDCAKELKSKVAKEKSYVSKVSNGRSGSGRG